MYLEGENVLLSYEKAAVAGTTENFPGIKWKTRSPYCRELCYALEWYGMSCFPSVTLLPNLWLTILSFWSSKSPHPNLIFFFFFPRKLSIQEVRVGRNLIWEGKHMLSLASTPQAIKMSPISD